MDASPVSRGDLASALPAWARKAGLVTDGAQERRLASMRLDVLAAGALPAGAPADVVLTARWAAFICWVDDHIDREGLGSAPGELERFTAPLAHVLAPGARRAEAPHAAVLEALWEHTRVGMPPRWRRRFAADYGDFLSASHEEAAVRRAGVRLSPAEYVRLRRRTITLLPMLDVLEATGHTPLVEHPRIDAGVETLRRSVADIAGWSNDLASQADDTAAGQDNLVTVLMRESRCTRAVARARATAMIGERRALFASTASALRDAVPGLPADTARG
ncbi:terpene synthase family protein, partial [Streptomyces sp. NPDC001985]|uniref:terpene synthase family protein n=1 Tax=Streptomyces sp. NPDC001985 TaxID=3154406 RepID=UPI00331C96C3